MWWGRIEGDQWRGGCWRSLPCASCPDGFGAQQLQYLASVCLVPWCWASAKPAWLAHLGPALMCLPWEPRLPPASSTIVFLSGSWRASKSWSPIKSGSALEALTAKHPTRNLCAEIACLPFCFVDSHSFCRGRKCFPKYPLRVCDLENLGNELICPILPVEIIAQHCKMETLYCVEMCWNMPICEFPPSYDIMAVGESFELRRHKPHLCKWLASSHEDIFRDPVSNLWIGNIIFRHPLGHVLCCFGSSVFIGAQHKVCRCLCLLQFGHLLSGRDSPE